ncbi:MAG: hypothetical protein CVV02_03905 [Firmicutes bacterium HGW-Firmicutes-7]|nr:MAG: hypothetical protein CVV02_03905 [Firmicutes bacterium HGW-Firmicutes-7]
MPSIEYGLDGYGKKTYPNNALSGRTYTCPYCNEGIHIRRCHNCDDYFSHNPILNRTPQQMICKGYTGKGAYKRIEDKIDIIYINNGGLPLYLCAYAEGKYELRAYFPPISVANEELLKRHNVKIIVSESKKIRSEYSANNLRSYTIRSTIPWIDVRCERMGDMRIPLEVIKKWEWGIRGLDSKFDIFHSHYTGGYRVARNSNILARQEYRIIVPSSSKEKILGINFSRLGSIIFSGDPFGYQYSVFSMVISEVTKEAKAYIEKLGYQLLEKSDEIVPLWPPAAIEGKELVYKRTDNSAFFYHKNNSEQVVFTVSDYGLIQVDESNDVFTIDTNNKTLILTDYFNDYSKEIRFVLTKNKDNYKADEFVPDLFLRDENSARIEVNKELKDILILADKKMYLESNVNVTSCILNKRYVRISSKRLIEKVNRKDVLLIDIEPFGHYFLYGEVENLMQKEGEIDFEEHYQILMKCTGPYKRVDYMYFDLMSKIESHSSSIFKLMKKWHKNNEIPCSATKYLKNVEGIITNAKKR